MKRGRFSDRTILLIAAISVGGAAAIGASLLAYPPSFGEAALRTCAILVGLTAAAELVGIRVQHGDSSELLTLTELAVVANIVLLPPSPALIVSLTGLALALLIQRRPPVKLAFNLGQYALSVIPAIALYHTIGDGDFSSSASLVGMVAAMGAFTAINLITISSIIAATTERPMSQVIAREGGLSLAIGIGNSAVGIVAVALYLTRPALVPAVLAPAVALHLAFRGWVKQKEFSRRMEDETTKLGRILDHSTEGIVLASADGSVVLWSPSMERITGIGSADALGKALPFLLRGQDVYGRAVTLDVSADSAATEIQVLAPDGTSRWLRIQHGPGFDDRGRLSFDVLVVTDVTRQREVERLKDDFVSTVSHELRTPLTPIKGYATLLLRRFDEIPPDRRREALQSIVERSEHMARLVEDLLLASRIGDSNERRLPDVVRQPLDLGSVVERALRSFQGAHPLREFRLDAPSGIVVLGDPLRVEQVIANLVSNAVKFSEEGAPVDVTVERDGTDVTIHVRDEGRGIPEDKYDDIFDKFKRLEDPLRMETGGAGLGLFIVRQLVSAMGGTVAVQSERGVGSTFTVTMIAAAANERALEGRRILPPNLVRRVGDIAG